MGLSYLHYTNNKSSRHFKDFYLYVFFIEIEIKSIKLESIWLFEYITGYENC